jgi:hypothetical protein
MAKSKDKLKDILKVSFTQEEHLTCHNYHELAKEHQKMDPSIE